MLGKNAVETAVEKICEIYGDNAPKKTAPNCFKKVHVENFDIQNAP